MNVNETADGVTHVALDGRFDIAGAQEVDGRFARSRKTRRSWSSTSPRCRSSLRSGCER